MLRSEVEILRFWLVTYNIKGMRLLLNMEINYGTLIDILISGFLNSSGFLIGWWHMHLSNKTDEDVVIQNQVF